MNERWLVSTVGMFACTGCPLDAACTDPGEGLSYEEQLQAIENDPDGCDSLSFGGMATAVSAGDCADSGHRYIFYSSNPDLVSEQRVYTGQTGEFIGLKLVSDTFPLGACITTRWLPPGVTCDERVWDGTTRGFRTNSRSKKKQTGKSRMSPYPSSTQGRPAISDLRS